MYTDRKLRILQKSVEGIPASDTRSMEVRAEVRHQQALTGDEPKSPYYQANWNPGWTNGRH